MHEIKHVMKNEWSSDHDASPVAKGGFWMDDRCDERSSHYFSIEFSEMIWWWWDDVISISVDWGFTLLLNFSALIFSIFGNFSFYMLNDLLYSFFCRESL